jgi:hypothetical protein
MRNLTVTLKYTGVNTTNWTANNVTGFYMGLALGNSNLNGTDYVTCEYMYNSSDNGTTVLDTIQCIDRYAMSTNMTTIDDK